MAATMRIAFITAGAAGMYCGSCLRDNALVTALRELGQDAILIPTYTPIRTDDADVSTAPVFYGGINVYLQEKSAFFRHTPRVVDKLFDFPRLLKWVSRFAHRNDYSELGGLTISMLRGNHGHQRKELHRLIDWLKTEIKPDVVLLTNVLLSGLVPELKRLLNVPIVATLQGDDIFLNGLDDRDTAECLQLIRGNCEHLAGLIATSDYYADHMAGYLGVPRNRIEVIRAGINLKGHGGPKRRRDDGRKVIGFFARIAPEKGLHHLVDAFIQLRRVGTDAVLRVGGWLGPQNVEYLNQQRNKLETAGFGGDFEHVDCPTHDEKAAFLKSLDVFTLPSVYAEPKGLPVLEAWANGVAAVLPARGCFPEIVADTGGGVLVEPDNPAALASAIGTLIGNDAERVRFAESGRSAVTTRYNHKAMAGNTIDYLHRIMAPYE
jgi:glycosyltransferase involved in cell wall biosynthesis